MFNRTFLLGFLLIQLTILSCQSGETRVKASLDNEFSLVASQAAELKGEPVVIQFEGVQEDSRCPKGAICVWQGRVTCIVNVIENGSSSRIVLTETASNDQAGSNMYKQYKFIAHVQPYPELNKKISNEEYRLFLTIIKVPAWLKPAVLTEYYIKIGLVCMGATILFSVIIKAGLIGMLQALLVVAAVWFFAYWLGRRFGMAERFSSTMATGVSICGVSASIAAGGAVEGDPKETSYVIAWLLVGAVIMIVVMPPIARAMNMPSNMAGAWIGGTIDNTGAVVAAGDLYKSKAALDTAALTKMAQNILIGFAAFFLAIWATFKLEKKSAAAKPSFMDIWYRFPKFIVGFIVASLIASFYIEPVMGSKAAGTITALMTNYRTWFFALCFVCIGLETNFKELLSVGGGKPAAVYWIAQTFNVVWTLFIVWLLWSGAFFTPPILPD
jgi:uncharacterized membrane protein YadS